MINGFAPTADAQGSSTVRRTMRGLCSFLSANALVANQGPLPDGEALSEPILNAALRELWQRGGASIDTIVVNGREKRHVNEFVASGRRFLGAADSYRDAVSVYESDFGVCRVLLSRYVPTGTVLLLDSTQVDVLPLAGRSFAYRPLAVTGDRTAGQVIGEYTLEVRNAAGMGMITGLAA